MLLLCFKLSSCLVANTSDTSVMYEKAKFVCLHLMRPQKNEIRICSNKHETCLVLKSNYNIGEAPIKQLRMYVIK